MTREIYGRTEPLMGTLVTIEVVVDSRDDEVTRPVAARIGRAFEWFYRVEACCTRFNPESELMQLVNRVGVAVPVSVILFEAVQFALHVAKESGGAFDPTVGHVLESKGFNREYSSDRIIETPIPSDISSKSAVSYRDVRVDRERKTITLLAPLVLDLGAVAKGLAIDLAAQELRPLGNFSINAGGDLYLAGWNTRGEPWRIGIRHPRRDNEFIGTVCVSNSAVCSSGDYERRTADNGEHHILNPHSRQSAQSAASVTVVAPTAMAADALATAAFVLGPEEGTPFLNRLGVDGLIITPDLDLVATEGMTRDYSLAAPAIL